MLNSTNFTESDDSDTMARHESDLEVEERYGRRKYCSCRQRQPEECQSYHDVMSSECCCGQTRGLELQDLERRPRRRTKNQARLRIPCNYSHETWKHPMERVNIFNNVDDALNLHECYLAEVNNQTSKKSQDLHPCDGVYTHPRKRQMSLHRRLCKSEQDPMILSTMRNTVDSETNPRACCEYEYFVKNMHSRDAEEIDDLSDDHLKKDQMVASILKNLEMRKRILGKNMLHKKERASRPEAWMSKQQSDKGKLGSNGKKQFSDDENRDLCRTKLRFDIPNRKTSKEVDLKKVEDDRENEMRKKPNALPNKPFAIKGNLKTCGLQTLLKSKNLEEPKNLTMERSLEEDTHKETEDRSVNKSRKPSTIRQSGGPNDEVTSGNRKENREDTPCELVAKNEEEEENSIRKNIYAGGDLELHATKSHILGLIDRAISNEFGNLPDQQQSLDLNEGLIGQEICIEIMRVLQGNCRQPLAEGLLSHRDSSVDYIKLLKMLRWDHMSHIQEEFRKLCSLQKFLDTYSPRQSLPAFQSYPVAVEQQRPEERQQQQHEEKQNSGTIP